MRQCFCFSQLDFHMQGQGNCIHALYNVIATTNDDEEHELELNVSREVAENVIREERRNNPTGKVYFSGGNGMPRYTGQTYIDYRIERVH